MDLVDPNLYLTLLPEAMKRVNHEFDKKAIITLYNTIDFIGISSYAGKGTPGSLQQPAGSGQGLRQAHAIDD
jgi:hypothetical protein